MSRMRPPLTTSMTGPSTTPSLSLIFSIVAPRPLVLGPLLGEDEPALLVLLLEDERLDLVAEADDLVRVDVVADGQLAGRDDALGLEADVEQDLVLVDLDDRALHDVAVVELDDGAGDGVLEGHAVEVVDGDLPGDVLTSLVGLLLGRRRMGGVSDIVRDGCFPDGGGAAVAPDGQGKSLPRGQAARRSATDQELGVVEVGRVPGVGAGRHRPDVLDA